MGLTRRELLGLGSTLALGGGCDLRWTAVEHPDDASYDAVLDRLHGTEPDFGGGLSNHAPMAIEALVALGREDRVAAWARVYARRLEPLAVEAPLSLEARRRALGEVALTSAWIATYLAELRDTGPLELLWRDFDALVPGYVAAGFHAVIRTAQGVRALRRGESPARRREVAHALGYWAGTWSRLPGRPGRVPRSGSSVVETLARLEPVPVWRRQRGLIRSRLRALDSDDRFAATVSEVDLDAQPVEQALSELCGAAARLYVADPGSGDLGYLHAVTGASALELLLPELAPEQRRRALGYAFQAVAAIHATHARSRGVPSRVEAPSLAPDDIAERAGAHGDEHVIKLAEACLREYRREPRPELLRAAEKILA